MKFSAKKGAVGFHFVTLTMSEIVMLGKEYSISNNSKTGRSLCIDGYEFKQNAGVSANNIEYLVSAVLEDKIILQITAVDQC